MTILDNSILHLTTVLFFLFGLGALVLSYLKRKYEYAAWGFIGIMGGFFQTIFIAVLKGDMLVLADGIDYGANYLFSLSVLGLGIVSCIGLTIFYLHRIIPIMFLQLGILLSSTLIVVTFGTSISQSLSSHKRKTDEDGTRFMKAEDFQKGSPNPKLTKASEGKDTVILR